MKLRYGVNDSPKPRRLTPALGKSLGELPLWESRLVLRDRDSDGDNSFDERLYGMQDANWNLTAIADAVGAVQERYGYSAYGTATVLDASFVERASSSFDWETRSAGYRLELESQLYSVRNRVLHPRLGGWVQRDPAGYSTAPQLYEYVKSKPTIQLDPFGLFGSGMTTMFFNPWLIRRIERLLNSLCPVVQHDFYACACCLIEAGDVLAGLVGFVLPREFPVIDEILNAMDCACDFNDMLNSICVVWNGTGTIWTGLGINFTAVISCMINIIDSFEVSGFIADRILPWVEVLLAGFAAQYAAMAGCTPCDRACQDLLQLR